MMTIRSGKCHRRLRTSWSVGSNCIDLVQPAFFFQCAFKKSCRGFDVLGRSGFRSRHEHVLHLLPHCPNSEGLGEVLDQ
jgi:hypothetical protein